MYNIGEGGTNLKKMDKHVKRKQGGNILNLFSKSVVNDRAIKKAKKKKVKVCKDDASWFKSKDLQSEMEARSRSTADSARFKIQTMTESQFTRPNPMRFSAAMSSSQGAFFKSGTPIDTMDLSQKSTEAQHLRKLGINPSDFSETAAKLKAGR